MIRCLLSAIIFSMAPALSLAQAANASKVSGWEAGQRRLVESGIKAYTGLTRFFVISVSFPRAEKVGDHHQDFLNWLDRHIKIYAEHELRTPRGSFNPQTPDLAQVLFSSAPARGYVFFGYSGPEDKAAVRAAINRALRSAPTMGFRYKTDYWSVSE